MDIQVMSDYHRSDPYDLKSLPDFDCICELCDCGCFERSKQPHSLNCRKFLRSNDLMQDENNYNSIIKNRTVPKETVSEYQYSFLNNSSVASKANQAKTKDSISFASKSILQNPVILNNKNDDAPSSVNSTQLRSKTLNRLNSMLPENSNVSWYQSDYNYYGNEPPSSGAEAVEASSIRKPYNALKHYKSDYLRNFEELNKGLVDSYSISKGGALLQIRNNNEKSSASQQNVSFVDENDQNLMYTKYLPRKDQLNRSYDNIQESQVWTSSDYKFDNQNGSNIRPHDFRPVWIPKKFVGRNMFASHIDSTIFPDKVGKSYETAYNQNFDSTVESKRVFEKPPYEKIEKSVRYAMNYENKYVPTIKWAPNKEMLNIDKFRESSSIPVRSSYQADYEKPLNVQTIQAPGSAPPKSAIPAGPICKSVAIQILMQKDRRLAENYEKKQKLTLSELEKRKNLIDLAISNS